MLRCNKQDRIYQLHIYSSISVYFVIYYYSYDSQQKQSVTDRWTERQTDWPIRIYHDFVQGQCTKKCTLFNNKNTLFRDKTALGLKKSMCVSSDMPKNIRVGRSEKSFFFIYLFFLSSDCQTVFPTDFASFTSK